MTGGLRWSCAAAVCLTLMFLLPGAGLTSSARSGATVPVSLRHANRSVERKLTAATGGPITDRSTITVVPVHLQVSVPASVDAGVPFTVTVTALDPSNATVTGFYDTIQLASTDHAWSYFGGPSTLASGTHGFTAVLRTAGTQTITATDVSNSLIAGHATVIVRPPQRGSSSP